MKAALIPPIAHLEEFCADDSFHLVLSHLLENAAYLSFYRRQHLRGAYLVLDNGAHENTSGEVMRDLLAKASFVRASEIVLPDTLFDHRATVRGAEDALTYLAGPGYDLWQGVYPPLMLVPQGRTRDEWERCFQDLIGAYVSAQHRTPGLFPRTLTIGVSKDYDMWPGGHYALLEFLEMFRSWMAFEVHLLGWAANLDVLTTLARTFPWVRSTDSAKPFVYAQAGIRLRWGASPQYPHRRPDYFASTLLPDQVTIARHNVDLFRRRAAG